MTPLEPAGAGPYEGAGETREAEAAREYGEPADWSDDLDASGVPHTAHTAHTPDTPDTVEFPEPGAGIPGLTSAAPQRHPEPPDMADLPAALGGGLPPRSPRPARNADEQAVPNRPERTVDVVAGDYLLTINPVDGSEVSHCPPADRPTVLRLTAEQRTDVSHSVRMPPLAGRAGTDLPLLERAEERERLVRLLARGRSVRVTGPSGAGRTSLLEAVTEGCADLAPDGVVQLSGYRRTPRDLMHSLFASVYSAPGYRPDRPRLLELLRDVGAIVVIDDIEFGGAALEELVAAAPDCAFLISATPDVTVPATDSLIEEIFLQGLSRIACLELLERAVDRALEDEEAAWAADLWFESEGLPLRFVQAGALLRQRDAMRAELAEELVAADLDPFEKPGKPGTPGRPGTPEGGPGDGADRFTAFDSFGTYDPVGSFDSFGTGGTGGGGDRDSGDGPYEGDRSDPGGGPSYEAPSPAPHAAVPLPTLAESAAPAKRLADELSPAGREALRFAVALGGECPNPAHLPALVGDTHGDTALSELVVRGLAVPVAAHYRLAAGVRTQLAALEPPGDQAHAAAQHFAWWSGHPSVSADRVAAEAEALLSAMAVCRDAGHHSTTVLLARSAAPAFAAALYWSAWERALRLGQEAARVSGEVAEEAYFHHELGVLALCTGNADRARAELEASIALRGALADRQGTVVGRRTLALVLDRTHGFDPDLAGATAGTGPALTKTPKAGSAAGFPVATETGAEEPTTGVRAFPGARADVLSSPNAVPPADGDGRAAATVISRRLVSENPRGLAAARSRRNLAVAGAGVLLAAVLGTVVALGNSAETGGEPRTPMNVAPVDTQPDDEFTDELPPADPSSPSPSPSKSGTESATPTDTSRPVIPEPTPTTDPTSSKPTSKPTTKKPTTKPPTSSKPPTSTGGTTDGGTTDGGTTDGGTSDGGTSDGGTSDGGTTDGGTADGGTTSGTDAGAAGGAAASASGSTVPSDSASPPIA